MLEYRGDQWEQWFYLDQLSPIIGDGFTNQNYIISTGIFLISVKVDSRYRSLDDEFLIIVFMLSLILCYE